MTRDPFSPKVFAGSGAAWSTGFPNSIEGSAPSIVQVRTQMAIFNRPQSYLVAQANEDVRGAGVDVARRQEEVDLSRGVSVSGCGAGSAQSGGGAPARRRT